MTVGTVSLAILIAAFHDKNMTSRRPFFCHPSFCRLLVALLLTPLAALHAASPQPANKPNVIIILTDDQGYGDIGVHGHPFLKTPNLDRLHAESVRFTDFHVAPMCSPTRGKPLPDPIPLKIQFPISRPAMFDWPMRR